MLFLLRSLVIVEAFVVLRLRLLYLQTPIQEQVPQHSTIPAECVTSKDIPSTKHAFALRMLSVRTATVAATRAFNHWRGRNT